MATARRQRHPARARGSTALIGADLLSRFQARRQRRTQIRREAARLVTTRGIEAARIIGRVNFSDAEFSIFERLAERCNRDLRGVDSATRREVSAWWNR